MKNLYSKSLMAAVAVMMLASCSNEEPNGNLLEGKTTEVAIGVSVLNNSGVSTKSTGEEVNLEGTGLATIVKPVIVPMVDNTYLTPIILDDITGAAAKQYTKASLLQTVNKFRVYANIPSEELSSDKVFVMPSLAQDNSTLSGYKNPFGLYYYTEAVASDSPDDNRFYVGTSSTPGDWEFAAVSAATENVGTNNRVKINGVKYAVGVLAVGVNVDLTKPDKQMFGENGDKKYSEVTPMTLSGITVSGQPTDFDATFTEKGPDISVYEEVISGREALKDAGSKISFSDRKVTGNPNVYCIVAPEKDAAVTVNFEFVNNTGAKFTLNDGTEIPAGAKFYLTAPLRKDNSNDIFEAVKTTLLNVTVTDWGKASDKPLQTTDAEIGVVIDTQWTEGMNFDVEI